MKCKNDLTRTYSGTEPSPKGLGWCAHAEDTGKVRKGRDGALWTVAQDKNGTKAWKKKTRQVIQTLTKVPSNGIFFKIPSKGKRETVLTFDGSRFSDNTSLSFNIGGVPMLYDGTAVFLPLTYSHWKANFSLGGLTLRLKRGPLPEMDVPVSHSPATVYHIFNTIRKFYDRKLKESDYKLMERDRDLHWNPLHVGKTMTAFKKVIKTYGDAMRDENMFEGLKKVNVFNPMSALYEAQWGS